MRVFGLIGDGHGHADVGVGAIGGEGFGAIQNPALAVADRGRAGATGVGTRFGLGERPSSELFALSEGDKVLSFLLFTAELVDVIRAERIVSSNEEADRAVDSRKLFDDGGVLDVAESGAAVFFGKNNAQQAHFRKLRENLARKVRGFVPLHHVRSNFALSEFADGLAELLLFVGESEIHGASLSVQTYKQ